MITDEQLDFVLSGIERQVPIYRSLNKLSIHSHYFYITLTFSQRRKLDEHKLLYQYISEDSIRMALYKRGIHFPEGSVRLLSQTVI